MSKKYFVFSTVLVFLFSYHMQRPELQLSTQVTLVSIQVRKKE
ncbi:unnamed protein product [Arabidopsis halleri]